MAIIRVNHTDNYTVMSNFHLRDTDLSLRAKGLLSQMLSLPPNWDFTVEGLVAINKENIAAIRSVLKELRDGGYLVITKKLPNETESGRYEYIYDIYEEKQAYKKQAIESQYIESQHIEGQHIESQRQLNKDNISKEILNTDSSNTDKRRFTPPTVEEVRSYCNERRNGVNPQKFIDHYTANGWMVGKNKMKDWKAAVRTWENNGIDKKTDASYDIDKAERKMNTTVPKLKKKGDRR